ncbi:zinc-binding alcohol dehydrogenase family protein [Verrucomicrobia bacterium LW23]|nr:zinc-binding alcohol dehydrogenase family protein [Verrucomicrobia bacterium LW23]
MKAVAFLKSLPIDREESLVDVSMPAPVPGPRDLLVEVHAVSVNPVDTKIRTRGAPQGPGADGLTVLGWDAAGLVVAVGGEVTAFQPGDAVYYAGSVDRPGCNSQYHVVDERIVARKPASLGFADAAALPLTAITAWEMLFDRLRIRKGREAEAGSILILGAAGGVGSIAIQLARRLTGLAVIATASRPETQLWCRDLGAHHVIDHRQPLTPQVLALSEGGVQYVLALTRTEEHFDDLVQLMAPQSAIAIIDDPSNPLDINKLKAKSISLHWEFMFTRSRFQTHDMDQQGKLLAEVAGLVDAGTLRSTVQTRMGTINAANLRKAHALLESGRSVGKIVLEGFDG